MSGKRITMADVARLAGLSKATVSRAIHSPHMVAAPTREKIAAVIKENQYVYDALAGDFSRSQASVLGLVIPTIRSSIFAMSTNGIQERAQQEGLAVLIGASNYDSLAEGDMLRLFQQRRVAGLILTGLEPSQRLLREHLTGLAIPWVVTWQTLEDPSLNFVGFDNFRAAHVAASHLISLGHGRIGLICGPAEKVSRVRQRRDGFLAALEEHGLTRDPDLILSRDYSLLEGRQAMAQLLELSEPPSAVFAASDVLAMGALAAIREKGLRVPEDISLVGFDDIDFAAYCHPPLTTVRVPAYEMGWTAVKALAGLIRGQEQGPLRYTLATELVVRESCAKYNPRRRVA